MATADLAKALEVRSCNTLHGINPYVTGGHIIGFVSVYLDQPDGLGWRNRELSWCSGERELYQQRIAEIAGIRDPRAFEIASSYGGDTLEVKLSHRRRIPAIINAALQAGLCIRMQTHLQSFYTPADAPFSLEQSERLALRSLNKTFQEFPGILESKVMHLGDEKLWKTEEGREFARRLKAQFPHRAREAEEPLVLLASPVDDPAIDYPLIEAPPAPPAPPASSDGSELSLNSRATLTATIIPAVVEETTSLAPAEPADSPESTESLTPANSNQSPRPESQDDPVTCMICLDAVANTMVLPCHHIVVCQTCSAGLRDTPDNKTCVQCRRPITTVLWEGGEEIKS